MPPHSAEGPFVAAGPFTGAGLEYTVPPLDMKAAGRPVPGLEDFWVESGVREVPEGR